MKTFIVVASLIALNFLGGCVVPQSPYGYGGIQSPAGIYEGILTPSLDYQEGAFGYDSYGQPYTIVGGQPSVIVFEANRGWGYYDIHRHWREAPRHMIGTLERDHPRGHGLPPPSPAHLMGQHPQGMPPMGQHPQGMPPMGQHPQGMPPMGQHPQGMPPMGQHPQGMLPMGQHPQGMPPMGQHPQGMPPMGQHPQGMPPMGQHPQGMLPMGQHPQGVPPKVNPTKKK